MQTIGRPCVGRLTGCCVKKIKSPRGPGACFLFSERKDLTAQRVTSSSWLRATRHFSEEIIFIVLPFCTFFGFCGPLWFNIAKKKRKWKKQDSVCVCVCVCLSSWEIVLRHDLLRATLHAPCSSSCLPFGFLIWSKLLPTAQMELTFCEGVCCTSVLWVSPFPAISGVIYIYHDHPLSTATATAQPQPIIALP